MLDYLKNGKYFDNLSYFIKFWELSNITSDNVHESYNDMMQSALDIPNILKLLLQKNSLNYIKIIIWFF